ncbi:MAG: type II secretion system protein [Kosmotoga sp.]|nr:MAG: type II secretion system protein [Kosmotoga sp.]
MRHRGFSLVELLIVLSVMAALIAVMIPIGMNAIRKAKAVKVARNLKSLAETTQNTIMINGLTADIIDNLYDYTSDIPGDYKLRIFNTGDGSVYICSLYTGTDVSTITLCEMLPDINYANDEYKIMTVNRGYFYVDRPSYVRTDSPVLAPLNSIYYSLVLTEY